MWRNWEDGRRKVIFLISISILMLLLGFFAYQLFKPAAPMSDNWIPVNLALEVALAEQGTQISAEVILSKETEEAKAEKIPAGPVLININTADVFELELLPGIGPVKAQAIIDYRQENEQFTTIEALLEVSGIGPATFENVKAHVEIK